MALYRGRQPTVRGPDPARQGISPGPRPFSFFNDRYAVISRRNNSHLIF